jgi:hypothetical protein
MRLEAVPKDPMPAWPKGLRALPTHQTLNLSHMLSSMKMGTVLWMTLVVQVRPSTKVASGRAQPGGLRLERLTENM